MSTNTIKPIPLNNGYMKPEDAIKLIERNSQKNDKPKNVPKKNDAQFNLEGIVQINPSPKLDRQDEEQEFWVNYYNQEKKIYASASDLYYGFKQLTALSETGSLKEKIKAEKFINRIREDFHFLFSSTIINYNKNNQDGTLIHHYGSQIIKPEQKEIIVPIYQEEKDNSLKNVIKKNEGLNFLQTLFGTNDSPDEISYVLDYISDVKASKILLYTLPKDERTSTTMPERVVRFNYIDNLFLICATDRIIDKGHSYWVNYK